jgi:dienelactone hydrolase
MIHRFPARHLNHTTTAALLLSAATLISSPARAFRDAPNLLRAPSTLRLQARAVIEGNSVSLLPSTAATRAETRDWESPAHRAKVPLAVHLRSREERDGLRWERVSFVSEPGVTVPALVARPIGPVEPLPAVVVLHGLGGTKEGMAGLMTDLARRGYLALAIDARWHGERGPGLQAAMIRAYREGHGHPYVFDTVFDLFRTLDYLQTRPDVDPERLGMIGVSMGGQETWITAALDPRVKVAVPVIGVNSFRWQAEHDRWHARANLLPQVYEAVRADLNEPVMDARVYRAVWDRLTPGLMDRFDGPYLAPLIAPRPLLVLNGETDPLAPVEAARRAAAAVRRAYDAAGVPERFRFEAAPGVGHSFTDAERREALDWFDHWLKPADSAAVY